MTRFLIALIALALTGCAGPTTAELMAGPNAVKHLADGRAVDIPPALAEFKTVAPYSTRFDLVLPGRRADFRVAGPQPTFLSSYPVPEIKLFRMERGVEYDDRNLKGRARSGGGPLDILFEIPSDVVVHLDGSREGDGLYRVMPRAPLPPGEYAFLTQPDMDRWQKYPSKVRIYSFGVD